MVLGTKEKKFIKDFIRLYLKYRTLEFDLIHHKNNKIKEKLNKLDIKINLLLPRYSILFEDMVFLEKIYAKTINKERMKFIAKDFVSFLKWTIKKIYREKIIDKGVFEKLNSLLLKINLETHLPGSILWRGR